MRRHRNERAAASERSDPTDQQASGTSGAIAGLGGVTDQGTRVRPDAEL